MKQSLITAAIAIAAIAISVALSNCSQLAGTTLLLDDKGNLIVMPPPKPIIIEVGK
jgi:hypothetical protein